MDKSWIKAKITSKTFKDGVMSFMDFARLTEVRGIISCPCLRCCNTKWLNMDTVHAHILLYGFLPGYTKWTFHGEHDTPSLPQSSNDTQTFPIQDDIKGLLRDALSISSLNSNIEVLESRNEGDIDSVEDTGPNSQQSIPTQQSNSQQSNSQQSVPNVEDTRYMNLLEECDKELYPGVLACCLTLKHQLKLRLFGLVAEKLKETDNDIDDGVENKKYTEEELLQGLDLLEAPFNFKDDQWEYYKNHLRSTKAKRLSQNGKNARAQQIHHRVTGSTSHARKKDEFKLKKKRQPYEVESFNILYQTKNGSYVKDISRELMDRASEEISKRELELKNNSEFVDPEARRAIETDVMQDLMGSDNRGRALCYGAGVKKSQLTNLSHGLKRLRGDSFRNDMLLGKLESQSKQIESQNKQIESQNKQIEAQNKQIEAQNKQFETMQQTMNVIRSELQLFQTAFHGMFGSNSTTEDAYFPTSGGFTKQVSRGDMDWRTSKALHGLNV